MKPLKLLLGLAGGMLAMSMAASASPVVTFNLDPADGQLLGAAGSSVGWGYTIAVSRDFVTIQSISFVEGTPIGVFGTQGLPLSAASAGSALVVPWLVNFVGLQYDINPGALLGNATQGVMTLVYDTYSDAALQNQIGFSDIVNASLNGSDVMAQVTVNAGPVVLGPEPGALGLVISGCSALAWWRRRR